MSIHGIHAGADLEEPVRAETPDPEDRRFQDDDGTWYIWDALLRKFVEEVRRSPSQTADRACDSVSSGMLAPAAIPP